VVDSVARDAEVDQPDALSAVLDEHVPGGNVLVKHGDLTQSFFPL
jgi:hypothetical protein